jgi:nucleotide-binding universal stress UspA family protein
MKTFETIIFPTDFSENSEYAFEYALSLAMKFNARLVVMHVINEPVDLRGFYVPHISFEKLEEEILSAAEKMMEKFCHTKLASYSKYSSCIVAGIPYDEILRKVEEEKGSLIVMGTHGRKGIDHFLFGSTTERVVRTAVCPVLTVRPPES